MRRASATRASPATATSTYNQDDDRDRQRQHRRSTTRSGSTAGPRPAGVHAAVLRARDADAPVDVRPGRRRRRPPLRARGRRSRSTTRLDDQASATPTTRARSWSAAKPISGSASFCVFAREPLRLQPVLGADGEPDDRACSTSRSRTSTRRTRTSTCWCARRDGGAHVPGPVLRHAGLRPQLPARRASRRRTGPTATARGQAGPAGPHEQRASASTRAATSSSTSAAAPSRDDFYLVISDNRNGTPASSNTDVFLFKSTDGGTTWIGPTRVNDDRSVAPDRVARRRCDNDRATSATTSGSRGSTSRATATLGVRLQRPAARHATRPASEWPMSRSAAGQLPDVVLRRRLPGRPGRTRATASLRARRRSRSRRRRSPPGGEPAARPGRPSSPRRRHRQPAALRRRRSTSTTRSGRASSPATTAPSPSRTSRATTGRRRAATTRSASGPTPATAAGRAAEESFQPGRNPLCEQSDAFATFFDPQRRLTTARRATRRRSSSRRARRARSPPRDGRFDGNPGHHRVGVSRRPSWPPRSRSDGCGSGDKPEPPPPARAPRPAGGRPAARLRRLRGRPR